MQNLLMGGCELWSKGARHAALGLGLRALCLFVSMPARSKLLTLAAWGTLVLLAVPGCASSIAIVWPPASCPLGPLSALWKAKVIVPCIR